MSEDEARAWVAARFPKAFDALAVLAAMVVAENRRQNLIAPSTEAAIWNRHVADSLQLVPLAEAAADGTWVDVGTGGGFPGLVVATCWDGPVMLVEPRRLRADFLRHAARSLRLENVSVEQSRVERVWGRADVISARAVSAVPALVAAARHLAHPSTRWLLPRGRHSEEDDLDLRRTGLVFHVEQSVTSSESSVIVLEGGMGPG